jgi:hypothetical protein
MTAQKFFTKLAIGITTVLILAACAPEVGSDAWCESMVEKSNADWTTNEATEFAKNCVFKSYEK